METAVFKEVVVRDFLYSIGGVLTDLPVGVFGVLKLEGADCFLARVAGDSGARPSTESVFRGRVSADRILRAEAVSVGVEVRRGSPRGELLPLPALLDARVPRPLRDSTGEVLPLTEDALLSTGEMVLESDGSRREALLLGGESEA